MAIGDAALAAGMDILSGNEPARTIDEEINKTRDYLATSTASDFGAAPAKHSHLKTEINGLQPDLDYLGRAVEALSNRIAALESRA